MQQHPVPRNITGFQFKLIGDMTLKQFGYLAVGVIVGYILFRALPLPSVLRLAVWLLFGGTGTALAFVPLHGRPLDIWIKAYFKNVYSPTQFVWKKQNPLPKILAKPTKPKRVSQKKTRAVGTLRAAPSKQKKQISRKQYEEVEQKLNSYLKKAEKKPYETLDKKENKALKQAEAVLLSRSGTLKSSYPDATSGYESAGQELKDFGEPSGPELTAEGLNRDMGSGEQKLKIEQGQVHPVKKTLQDREPQKIADLSNGVKQETSEEMIRKRIRKELEQQYKEELKHLKSEKVQIEKKIRGLETPDATHQEERHLSIDEQAHLRILSQEEAAQAGLPLSVGQPNIIIGTIIDPQEQQLPGILVTIKNRQGRIVRALKTNNLGQFVSLTPLPNGEYILEAEDPDGRFKFDIIRIRLHGKKFPPIAIVGKTEKESKQDEIRKKLFNKQADLN